MEATFVQAAKADLTESVQAAKNEGLSLEEIQAIVAQAFSN